MPSQPAQTLWISRQVRPSRAAPSGGRQPPATGLGSTCPAPTAARFGGAEPAAAAGERVLWRAGRQSRIFGGRMSRLRGALRRRQAAASGRARGCRGPGSTHSAGTVRHLGRGAGWTAGTARDEAPRPPAACDMTVPQWHPRCFSSPTAALRCSGAVRWPCPEVAAIPCPESGRLRLRCSAKTAHAAPRAARSPPRRRAAACRRGGGRDARATGPARLDAGSAQPLGRP